ncbi:MAG: class I SAM-dependent methyltransferase [Polyangiaceae bacterium]|nr:class I SAM-dependent methyltransferase [Polyangiaceae bacterium]
MNTKAVHSHASLVGLFGLVTGGVLCFVLPELEPLAGRAPAVVFRVVGVAVVAWSLYSFAPRWVGRRFEWLRIRARDDRGYDFGWSWASLNAPWMAAGTVWAVALGLQLELPSAWPAWFALSLLGVGWLLGGMALRSTRRLDVAPLPLVDLLRSDHDLVLDAGCGAGRTTLALSKVLGRGSIVALDRFDAYYIDGGGRALLERNLRLAGLGDRVRIEPGDLTALPFPDGHFDSAVSAHVIDHMKQHKEAALAEIHRVLAPGGRLLLVVWVPGWTTFALANVFSFLLTSKAGWRRLAKGVGFDLRDEGTFNGNWFAVLERPLATP